MAHGSPRRTSSGVPSRVTTAIDPTVAHSPRIWNFWLGGKDNYAVDREVGERLRQIYPQIVDVARTSRAFLGRAVAHLAGEAGVEQFLDIGAGLPAADNTHEVAQRVAPGSRVVYVDSDPVVLAHARALLVGTPDGSTTCLQADLRDPDRILAAARHDLDFTRPIGLLLLNVLGHVVDVDEARAVVAHLVAALPVGSHLVVADGTNVVEGAAVDAAVDVWNRIGSAQFQPRRPDDIARFFDGLELLEPGVVSCPFWRPTPHDIGRAVPVDSFCGVGRKAG